MLHFSARRGRERVTKGGDAMPRARTSCSCDCVMSSSVVMLAADCQTPFTDASWHRPLPVVGIQLGQYLRARRVPMTEVGWGRRSSSDLWPLSLRRASCDWTQTDVPQWARLALPLMLHSPCRMTGREVDATVAERANEGPCTVARVSLPFCHVPGMAGTVGVITWPVLRPYADQRTEASKRRA